MAQGEDEMGGSTYLRRPRGAGLGYSFKMPTPTCLVGLPNPRTGKAYGLTNHEGLKTRSLREARRRRDLLLGQIRAEEVSASGENRISDEAARAIAEMRRK